MGRDRLPPSPSSPGRAGSRRAAAVSALAAGLAAVQDALRELEQALAGGGGGGDPQPRGAGEDEAAEAAGPEDAASWSAAERQLLGPCAGLVKAARACLKRALAAAAAAARARDGADEAEAADEARQVDELEALAGAAGDVSPSVDELVLSLYPPVNPLTLRLNAGKLASVLKKILEIACASRVCAASEEDWVQFLAGAVDHNMDKIKGFTQGLL